MRPTKLFMMLFLLLLMSAAVFSQDSASLVNRLQRLPQKLFSKIDKQAADLENSITSHSSRALHQLLRQEAKLKRRISKRDSLEAARLFSGAEEQYAALIQKVQQKNSRVTSLSSYLPHLDSLATGLKFISTSKYLPDGSSFSASSALPSVQHLEGKFQQAEEIKEFIHQRRQQLKEQLQRYGLLKELNRYNRESYYYIARLQNYKAVVSDPEKLGKEALPLLQKLPSFQHFMQQNSMLATLFPMPSGNLTAQPLAGLQTRNQVQNLLQNRLATGGQNAAQMLQQNVQQAQAQLNGLKDKISKLGGGTSDMEIPDFKPNSQHTKTFLQRLEYGTNLQSQKSNGYFPTTTDIGLSVGYRLNDKSIVGLGASYKIGWGKDISHIRVSNEGVGLRSFVDVKLRGSFYASGGLEYNYQQPFNSIQHLPEWNEWQRSGLAGITKVVSLRSKLFKKTKVQLLWDFLSYKQRPETQPLKFRVGYAF